MRLSLLATLIYMVLCAPVVLLGQNQDHRQVLSLDKLELHNVKATLTTYRGVPSVQLTDSGKPDLNDASRFALVRGLSFQDGTIEIALSGDTAPDAPPEQRGFVGVAFRVSADESHFECFYLRPKNGRSEDPVQRNHSAQYISIPGFPWQKLRFDTPGKYEAYVDLLPGEWTKVRLYVKDSVAKLYVNGAEQPILVVNDLKQTSARGGIALWIGPGTIAHFTDLKLAP